MRGRWWAAAGAAGIAALWLTRSSDQGASLEGRVALVTGGSRGLGFLLAEELLRHGCRVTICGRDPETLERAGARLREEPGGDVWTVACDISDAEAVSAMVDEVVERSGSLDLLLNNAAVIQVAPLETLEVEDFRRAMEVDFMGAVHTTLAALPHMRRQGGGRIANVTSVGGTVAIPHLLPYDCGKHALVGFSEGLRAAVAADGISVTTVVPGLMRTASPLHVEYRGQPEKEFRWFALLDLLPPTSMSAGWAAKRIVRAVRRGEAEPVFSWRAKLLRLAHDLVPGLTRRIGVLAEELLPGPDGARSRTGVEMPGALPGPAEDALHRLARRTNQLP